MGKISIRGSRTKLARDILEMAGAETLSDGNDRGGNFNFSAESLFKFNPWAVFSMSFIGSDSGNRSSPFDKKVLKGISGLTALKENRYWIPPADDDSCWMTSWFGPNNFALGVLWTAKKLYPSLFQDISLNEAANEFYLKVYGLKRTSLPDHNCLK
jgi:ABC-type Fe3+-hydroxamate transport system substrate-binding protein